MYKPLYVKSNYSLLSSLLRIDDIINYSLKNNISSCALTDDNMFGMMEFYNKCQKNKLKPIIGLEIKIDDNIIVSYAENYEGYKNLIKLSTIQSEKKIEKDDLIKYNKSLITVIPNYKKELYNTCLDIYEKVYLGYKNKHEEKEVLEVTEDIVFFKQAQYLEEKNYNLLDFLYRIRDGKTMSDEENYDVMDKNLLIEDILLLSNNIGLLNQEKIICECNLEFPKTELLLPIYNLEGNVSTNNFLFSLAKKGLFKRLSNDVPKIYQERLIRELTIIKDMGFSNYFLVVYDYIRYAKQNGILVGPGRGSAAGSLVAYSLGITDIDPLKYDLLFERFLNPERITMPDIDTDFPDDRRMEVIEYVTKKYGKKNVAGIVTFGTLGAKQVIRDVGRVLNIPIYKIDSLSKLIPTLTKDTLKEFYNKNRGFQAMIDSDYQLKKMYDIAINFEGFPRHTSSHAAGIVMCQKELDEVVPLTVSDETYLTSFSMEYLEGFGLLKMDFLGLKNLSLISNIIKDVQKNSNEKIDFATIPLDDKETLGLFSRADTTGIFQFESTGMRAFLRKLKPDSFEDIFAAIALFRPGPAVNIDSYIRRKHKEEKITYLDPSLEKVLKNTYGILIYQEQIMQVASIYAGYSLGEADILRRAMSKKKFDLLKNEEEKFVKKSVDKGHDINKSKEIFSLILNFAGYGFNRSHSVAYSLIAYKMAYLKVRYKNEFYSNILSNVIGSDSKTKEYITEAKSKNIIIMKPDINISGKRYVIKDNKIYFPFSNIKAVGVASTSLIIKAREKNKFTDIYDAVSRLVIEGVTEKIIENLIYADCFKNFGYNRQTLINNLDSLMNYASITKDIDPSLVMKPDIEETHEYNDDFLLEKEKEIYGFYLSQHPITKYRKDNKETIFLNTIKNELFKKITVLIFVEKVKEISTKKGDKMAFILGSDETGTMDFTVFPNLWSNFSFIKKNDLLKVGGVGEKRLDKYQIIVKEMERLNEK